MALIKFEDLLDTGAHFGHVTRKWHPNYKQYVLMEDAMLIHRIMRAPERRIFKIDVGNIPPQDVEQFMQKAITSMKRNQVVDSSTGKVDLRYNPMSVEEDYYIPVRGGTSQTKIDTIQGGKNADAIEIIANMALNSLVINPDINAINENLHNKHFYRKHGENKSYGQK